MKLPGALRVASLLAILIAILGAALTPNPLTVVPAGAVATVRSTLPYTNVQPLAVTAFLDREVEPWKRELTLKLAREAGIGWIKIQFAWEGIEPRRGQDFDDRTRASTWEKYDQIVDLAGRYGLRVIARLDRPPAWARPPGSSPTTPPANFDDFGTFVRTVVGRYKGKIRHYQIWNEPNLAAEWGGRPVDPAGYTRLLEVAAKAARTADPDTVILSAPLAQTLERGPENLNELDYLEGMYRADAGQYFNIMSANGYGFEFPPDDPPDPNVLNFQRARLLRDVMVRNGDDRKPVWFEEFGWNASPASFAKEQLTWRRVSDEEQATYTARAIELARGWGWVGVISLWYFRQVGDIPPSDSAYFFRLVDVDFTPRPIYHAIRRLSESWRVAPPGRYEVSNPASELRGSWSYRADAPGSTRERAATTEIGSTAAFRFAGTDVDLFALRDERAGRVGVWVDGRPAIGLPRDAEGRAYLELRRNGPGALERLPLVAAAGPGTHRLELSLLSDGHLTVDGFEVRATPPSYLTFYVAAALFGLGLIGFVASLIGRGQPR